MSANPALPVDAARQEICSRFGRMLREGAGEVRVRVTLRDSQPEEVFFYKHQENTWHKEAGGVQDAALVRAIDNQVDTLVNKPQGDVWSTRVRSKPDLKDLDVRFDRDQVDAHEKNLESWVEGLLFFERGDPGPKWK